MTANMLRQQLQTVAADTEIAVCVDRRMKVVCPCGSVLTVFDEADGAVTGCVAADGVFYLQVGGDVCG